MTIGELDRLLEQTIRSQGNTVQTRNWEDPEPSKMSKIVFRKDAGAERDRQIVEGVLQEIMENRGVSREEAERILNNPF